jgi:hypothetical protein
MPGGAADRWSLRGGPPGCAPRRRSPRPAARPRRSTPRVPTAGARGLCRRHRPGPRLCHRAGPWTPPARRPTPRSAEPGRHPGGRGRPSVGVRAPRRGRRHAPAPPARPGCRRRAADLAGPAAAARAAVTIPGSRPRRRLGGSGHGRVPHRAPAGVGRGGRSAGTYRRAHLAGPLLPGASRRQAPASDLGRAHHWACRPAPAHPHPVPSAWGRPVGPPADPVAPTCPERVASRTTHWPRRCPCGWVTGHHCVDQPPGRGACGRGHGGWWAPWRSGYLCPDGHRRDPMREEGRPGGRPSSRRNPAATYSPRQSPAKYHRRWRA